MSERGDTDASPRLVELPFADDIKRLTEDFAGREWVSERINTWLKRSEETLFILTGEAGIGKSAIAAHLIQTRDDIAAYNFCISGRNSTIVPGTVLRSLAAQLGRNLPEYGLALANTVRPEYLSVKVEINVQTMKGGQITGAVIRNLAVAEPKQELESLLTAPLSSMAPPERPVLLLIDSLDEAFTYGPADNLVTLLSGLGNLPSWVRLVLTTRPEGRVLSYFESVPRQVIAAESGLNRDDLRRYVRVRVARETIKTQLRAAQEPLRAETLVETIAGVDDNPGLADGNFLFAKMLLNDIESSDQDLRDLNTLPKSLDEIYHRFLLRLAPDWETKYLPLLAILAVAQEPLTRQQISQFGAQSARLIGRRLSETLVILALDVLDQFLDRRGPRGQEQYAIFHQSLRDYLGDAARSGRFYCPAKDGHAAVANHYLEQNAQDWSTCDRYGMRHLPTHLIGAEQWADVRAVLLDFLFLRSKLARTDIVALLADLAKASASDRGADESLQTVHDALRRSAGVLAEDGDQLPGQLLGRLRSAPSTAIRPLLEGADHWREAPWLRPLTASLVPPGDPFRQFIRGHKGTVRSMAITADGRWGATAGNSHPDQTVRVWDLVAGIELLKLDGEAEPGGYNPIGLTPGGQAVLVARGNEIRVWQVNTGNLSAVLEGHQEEITGLAVAADGRRALSTAEDGSLTLWDLRGWRKIADLPTGEGAISNLAISANSRYGVIQTLDGFQCWDLDERSQIGSLAWPGVPRFSWYEPQALSISSDGRRVLFFAAWRETPLEEGSASYTYSFPPLQSWEVGASTTQDVFERADPGHIVAIAADSEIVLSSRSDMPNDFEVWDYQRGKKVKVLPSYRRGSSASYTPPVLTPDGSAVLLADYDHNLILWHVRAARETVLQATAYETVEIAAEGEWACALDKSGAITKAWDLQSGEIGPESALEGLAHKRLAEQIPQESASREGPEGKGSRLIDRIGRLFKGSQEEEAQSLPAALVMPPSAMKMAEPEPHPQTIPRQTSSDGRYAVSAADDRTVRLWDQGSGACLAVFTNDIPMLNECAISGDGRRVAALDVLGRVHLLALEGEP